MAEYRPPEREKNALDNTKLRMVGAKKEGAKSPPTLSWQVVNNNPWITVYSNDPEDAEDNGRITAKLDITACYGLLELFREVINGPRDSKFNMENKNFKYYGNQRSEAPTVVSSVYLGKTADGVVWISVTAPNRPRIKFEFDFGDYHKVFNSDGNAISREHSSKLIASSYLRMLESFIATIYVSGYKHPESKEQTRRPQNGRQNQRQENSNEEDVPF